jgi:hypothetical protein
LEDCTVRKKRHRGKFSFSELITSVYGFKANLKTLKAQDEILGNVLDTVA